MHSYHTANDCLPAAGYYLDPGLSYDTIVKAHTWIESLLPYIEQQGLYDLFDLSVPITEGVRNAQARGRRLGVMLCPSDPFDGTRFNGTSYTITLL